MTTAALADSPSFHYANASIDSSTGQLAVSFKLTGLGTGVSSVQIALHTDASATYQCFNNGGNHPKAGNKETFSGPIDQPGTFPVSHGQVTDTAYAGPLGPQDFTCPSGQTRYLQSVSYSGITMTTASGSASTAATPSTIGPVTLHIPA